VATPVTDVNIGIDLPGGGLNPGKPVHRFIFIQRFFFHQTGVVAEH